MIQPYRHAAQGSARAAELFDEINGAVLQVRNLELVCASFFQRLLSVCSRRLQRHRQLGAHEVGHTLGLAHNYMGSTYTGCAEYDPVRREGCDAT